MGGFGHVMKSMLNWQPSGSPAWQRQQEEKIRQSQEARAQQEADLAFHQHLIELGAQPVVNGMVKDIESLGPVTALPPNQSQQPAFAAPSNSSDSQAQQLMQRMSQPGPGDSSNLMDEQGNPNPAATFGTPSTSKELMQAMMPAPAAGNLHIVRKADPANMVKWKDATGDTVAYELPTPDSQRWNQMMKLRAQSLQQQTAAEEQGRLDAQNRQRDQFGSPLSGDLADKYGVDPNQKFLPGEKVQLATRYFPVVGAGVRGQATKSAAEIRADAAKYKSDLDNQTKQSIAEQDSMDRQDMLSHRDRWNAAIVGARNNGQTNLNARAFLNGSARDMALHTTLLGNISKENQHQMLAQSLLANGPDGQPVTKDGDQFPDPFSGRTLTMNAAQRIRLGSALTQSQSTVADYQKAAAELESRRDQILNRFGGGAAPGGPSLDGGPGSSPSGEPRPGGGSDAPAAGPGSVNWAPRGRGVEKVANDVNAAAATPGSSAPARTPTVALPGQAHPAPSGPPTNRPMNWADHGRMNQGATRGAVEAGTQQQGKVATQAQVNAYAQKKGITPAAALQEFKAAHYTVQ